MFQINQSKPSYTSPVKHYFYLSMSNVCSLAFSFNLSMSCPFSRNCRRNPMSSFSLIVSARLQILQMLVTHLLTEIRRNKMMLNDASGPAAENEEVEQRRWVVFWRIDINVHIIIITAAVVVVLLYCCCDCAMHSSKSLPALPHYTHITH